MTANFAMTVPVPSTGAGDDAAAGRNALPARAAAGPGAWEDEEWLADLRRESLLESPMAGGAIAAAVAAGHGHQHERALNAGVTALSPGVRGTVPRARLRRRDGPGLRPARDPGPARHPGPDRAGVLEGPCPVRGGPGPRHGSFVHRRINAAHLIREAQRWNALTTGEPERIVTTTLADFAKPLDRAPVPTGIPRQPRRNSPGTSSGCNRARRSASDRSGTAVGVPRPLPQAQHQRHGAQIKAEALVIGHRGFGRLGCPQQFAACALHACGASPPDSRFGSRRPPVMKGARQRRPSRDCGERTQKVTAVTKNGTDLRE